MQEIILNDGNKITVEHLPTCDIIKLWEGQDLFQTYAIRKEGEKYLIKFKINEEEKEAPRELMIAAKIRLMAAIIEGMWEKEHQNERYISIYNRNNINN